MEKSINLRRIARELGIGSNTLYRVLNRDPHVGDAMRARITGELNKRGIFTGFQPKDGNVIFDFHKIPFIHRIGMRLKQKLEAISYSCIETDYRLNREEFLNRVCEAQTICFCSDPDEEIIREVRRLNPDIFLISLFGFNTGVDILLRNNILQGLEVMAHHFHSHGHRKILCFEWPGHYATHSRNLYFSAYLQQLDPQVEVFHDPVRWSTDFPKLLKEKFPECTAIWLQPELLENFFSTSPPELLKKISYAVTSEHNTSDFPEARLCDRLEINLNDLEKMAEYFLSHRPFFAHLSAFQTQFNYQLTLTGSVKNLT